MNGEIHPDVPNIDNSIVCLLFFDGISMVNIGVIKLLFIFLFSLFINFKIVFSTVFSLFNELWGKMLLVYFC